MIDTVLFLRNIVGFLGNSYLIKPQQKGYTDHRTVCPFCADGRQHGAVGLAGDSIPVYSKVQGKTVYVRGDQAQAYVRNDAVQYAKKKEFVPRKDKRKGSENRQPTGSRERNVGHPDGEEHSIKPKGNRGCATAKCKDRRRMVSIGEVLWGGVGVVIAGVALVAVLVVDDASGIGAVDNAGIPAALALVKKRCRFDTNGILS